VTRSDNSPPASLMAALAACAAVAAIYIFVRLYVFADQLVPLTYALPLLLGIWHRNRALNAAQIVFYCGLSLLNAVRAESTATTDAGPLAAFMMLVNIVTVGLVIDRLIVFRARIQAANQELQRMNLELEASNEDLAAREEEITSQNEELQQQAEELEQQSLELQQQTEELQSLHEESVTRAQLLQALLHAATSNDQDSPPLDQVCAAAVQAFGCEAAAVLISQPKESKFGVHGQYGLPGVAAIDGHLTQLSDEFVSLVAAEGRTACIENLAEIAPARRFAVGPHFQAVLATPLRISGQICGVLAIYSSLARHWSEAEFSIIHWFAAQASLVLRTLQLQEELDLRSRQAEETSRQKTRFLAAVSHDVRNPANAINLMAELIQRSGDDPRLTAEIPRLAESLRANTRLLVELVSDVLDLSRFDSGKIDLEISAFDPVELVQAEVRQYESLAANAGLSLVVEANFPRGLRLCTDRMKLARVVGNLVNNAIKFTEVGSVRTSLRQLDDGSLELSISDTGVGIAPEHLERIFDEFYQIQNPERDRNKGTGLGLAICKRLVDAIDGTLTVHSELGKGTTFTLKLPAKLVVTSDEECEPVPQPSAGPEDHVLSGLNVLVVEDHETTRHAVAQLLASHGAVVDPAEDGRAALRHLRHDQHDVVLLDLMLPDMDGREILRHLQGQRPTRLKCVLAVSGDVSETRRQELDSLGATALIPKPVEMDQLVRRILQSVTRQDASDPN
jgi:signal transduction histidine kinase/ActR/RegA family two-component response regulator